jgi:HPt (histidine-containing phosphotransfer) domain-containing protein
MTTEDLRRDLERLREDYRHTLRRRLARLGELLHEARAEPAGLENAAEVVHTLKGTAGSYGFEAVATEMRGIEDRLAHLARYGPASSAVVWYQIEQALLRARDSLESARRAVR